MWQYRQKQSLIITAILAGAVLTPFAVTAAPSAPAYEMKTYVDYGAGPAVLAGDYAKAIRVARRAAGRDGESGLIANTNLCVAYTKTARFEEAERACSRAVSLSESTGPSASVWAHRRSVERRDKAIALSNRGVLRAVSGDVAAAARDFRAAASLAAVPAKRNLAQLETQTDQVAMTRRDR